MDDEVAICPQVYPINDFFLVGLWKDFPSFCEPYWRFVWQSQKRFGFKRKAHLKLVALINKRSQLMILRLSEDLAIHRFNVR